MKNSYTNFHYPNQHLPRTDLACESVDCESSGEGNFYREYKTFGIPVSELIIGEGVGEASAGRKAGRYVTVRTPVMRYLSEDEKNRLIGVISCELITFTEKISNKPVGPKTKVLVAGLGNRFISADSIGPRTADKIAVTGHVMGSDTKNVFDELGCSSISCVHPGVMGQTGIEAAAMIKGAAEYVRPDVIIAVDALAARATKRLCSTIQLCDTGIEPGSGIGNRRGGVNIETVGFPVIALGVPTVVDCATLVFDTLSKSGICNLEDELDSALSEERSFFVSLRDSDIVSEEISSILAGAINRAFLTEGL